MVEQEEKRWLRALLEGEVEPGSEEWEQVCTDSAFTRVREKVGAVARLDFTQQEDEVEGMWRVLVDRRKKGLERRGRGGERLLRGRCGRGAGGGVGIGGWVSIRGVGGYYTQLRAPATPEHIGCRLLLGKKKQRRPPHLLYL